MFTFGIALTKAPQTTRMYLDKISQCEKNIADVIKGDYENPELLIRGMECLIRIYQRKVTKLKYD